MGGGVGSGRHRLKTGPRTGSCEWGREGGGCVCWGRAAMANLLKDNILGVPELLRLGGGYSCLGGREKPTSGV